MIGVLIVAGIVFYGVLYSGLEDLAGTPISIYGALTGKETPAPAGSATPTTATPPAVSGAATVSGKPLP